MASRNRFPSIDSSVSSRSAAALDSAIIWLASTCCNNVVTSAALRAALSPMLTLSWLFTSVGRERTVSGAERCTARAARALHQLDALYSSGQSSHGALAALSRHFQRLHRVCAAIEAGAPAKSAVSGFRPPLHFKLQDALISQARRWSEAGAANALERVNDAVRATRTMPQLETELTERLVLSLNPK